MIPTLMLLFALAIPLALAYPATEAKQRPWLRFLIAIPVSIAAVLIPPLLFYLSAFLTPDWKGGARCGWIDGFHTGKFALTPIVLFATAALYRLEVIPIDGQPPRWVALGLYCGAFTSILCYSFGFACMDISDAEAKLALICYIPIWYFVRAVQLAAKSNLPGLHYLLATLGMLPFWIGSAWWSRRVFEALPDKQPKGCFVVTAAGRGHHGLVGPFFEIEHNGARQRVNRQLDTFWRFETAWRRRSARSHRLFRRLYNRIGPSLAARITSPWRADIVFLALKPLEYFARAAGRFSC